MDHQRPLPVDEELRVALKQLHLCPSPARKKSFRPSEISNRVFVGGIMDAKDLMHLYDHGIRVILCCSREHARSMLHSATSIRSIHHHTMVSTSTDGSSHSGTDGEGKGDDCIAVCPRAVEEQLRDEGKLEKEKKLDSIGVPEPGVPIQKKAPPPAPKTSTGGIGATTAAGTTRLFSGVPQLPAELLLAGVEEKGHRYVFGTIQVPQRKNGSRKPQLDLSSLVSTDSLLVVEHVLEHELGSTAPDHTEADGANDKCVGETNKKKGAQNGKIVWVCLPIMDNEDVSLFPYLPETTRFLRHAVEGIGCGVLVHCMAGRSRSVSVVCGYLLAEWARARQAFQQQQSVGQKNSSDNLTNSETNSSHKDGNDLEDQKLRSSTERNHNTHSAGTHSAVVVKEGQQKSRTVAVVDYMRSIRLCVQPNDGFMAQLMQWEESVFLV